MVCDAPVVAKTEVREAQLADLDVLVKLYGELADDVPSAAPGDLQSSRAALEAVLEQSGRHLLVCQREARVVGSADLVIVPNVTHRGTPWAIVENVVVARAARRQGIGRALFARISELARDAGCHKIALLSGKHRREAHAFYESLGYEPVAEGFKLYFDR